MQPRIHNADVAAVAGSDGLCSAPRLSSFRITRRGAFTIAALFLARVDKPHLFGRRVEKRTARLHRVQALASLPASTNYEHHGLRLIRVGRGVLL